MMAKRAEEIFVVVNTEYLVDMLAYHSDETYQVMFRQNASRLINSHSDRHTYRYFSNPLSVERTVFRVLYDWKRWRQPSGSLQDQHQAFEDDFQNVLGIPEFRAVTPEEEAMRQRLLGQPLLMETEFERLIKRATHFNRLSTIPKEIGSAVLARATNEG